MSTSKKLLEAASGGAGGDPVTIDQVFSIQLRTSTGATAPVTNSIDNSGEGGLVWTKSRSNSFWHVLYDTERGGSYSLTSNNTNAQATNIAGAVTFNNNGYSIAAGYGENNASGYTYVDWNFRKASKFFDVVTYTGNGGNLTVNHNLGSVPGMIIIKCTTAVKSWVVYHRGVNGGSSPEDYALFLNTTAAQNDNLYFQDTAPTSTQFFLGDSSANENNQTHIAYLFADNSSEDAADRMISCGSYTASGTSATVNLGFEPSWIMVKSATESNTSWIITDSMRGMSVTGSAFLKPNASDAEAPDASAFELTATGFVVKGGVNGDVFNSNSNHTYIYMAVRAPMMVEPTDATKVFAVDRANGSDNPCFVAGFPVDFGLLKEYNNTGSFNSSSRLTSGKNLSTSSNGAEASNGFYSFASNTSWFSLPLGSEYYSWMWKRAKGFFDVVAYSGTYPAPTLSHSLSTVPEMVVFKSRESCGADDWYTFHTSLGTSKYVALNSNAASTTRNSWITLSASSVTGDPLVSQTGTNYIMYLFASLAGVSKVSSVVHSGTTNVDAGFTAGSRFVLLKRTDASGDWYIWDSVRGIVSGNDPYLLLNSTAAEVTNTDYIDPYSAGFTITSSFTAGTYIYYAIA